MTSPWLKLPEASAYARCGPKALRGAAKRGELKAARLGARGDLIFHRDWPRRVAGMSGFRV